MLQKCLIIIINVENIVLFNVENIDSLMNRKHLFYSVFTVTFVQFNVSLLNKSINFFYKILLTPNF